MKIFCVTYGGGHVAIVKALYPYLSSKKDVEVSILALTTSTLTLCEESIPHKKISSYLSIFPYQDKILEYGEELAQQAYDKESGLSYEDIKIYLGLSFYDLVTSCGSYEKAMEKYITNGRKCFFPLETMMHIVEYEMPDVLLVTSGQRMEKAAAFAANKYNIPVVRIEDLPGEARDIEYKCKLLVMNDNYRQIAAEHNPKVDIADICVTGHPVFELNSRIDQTLQDELEKKLKLKQYKNVIVFFTECNKNQYDVIRELDKIARRHPEDLIIIKPHPNQFDISYDFESRNCLIDKSYSAKYYLSICTVAMTTFSTVGLEAALLDKMLIVINTENEIYSPDYCALGYAEKVGSLDELERVIYNDCIENKENQNRLRRARERQMNCPDAIKNIWKVFESMVMCK